MEFEAMLKINKYDCLPDEYLRFSWIKLRLAGCISVDLQLNLQHCFKIGG
jgi:hypothetical protein